MLHSTHPGLALIVGGTSGIGLATAQRFVAAGHPVVVSGRSMQRGAQALQLLGAAASFIACDATQPASMAALVQAVTQQHGALAHAVNCAAADLGPSPMHAMAPDDAQALVQSDFWGVYHGMKYQVEAMLASGGTIVNLASTNGLSGAPGAALYSAAKHAVVGLGRSAAREYIASGIRINTVCPGATDTPRRSRRMAQLEPEQAQLAMQQVRDAIPLGRLASADEVAQAIYWLSSPASSYVVGHCLVVDGGLSA
jgi:NAD(P)-dependent dehydrogenase (short-subunit alcohol dehydrogenase family)